MGRVARERIRAHYQERDLVASYRDIYGRLMAAPLDPAVARKPR
jgi:hypothetical protein